ncbi:hypothetical protein K469DRAFT_750004 [Zopfia rhizophila CBS 207.26]|uniref:Uncharacterized protein n=1 Tax=Zopfia rhizophila CBS 207.26 TaxID=1314779 RepID=A0A6A6E4C3_9PEZI|nr:hypothetical protein K469DRAFT_750004 [Zopfia rhizophila CBS 207.26]
MSTEFCPGMPVAYLSLAFLWTVTLRPLRRDVLIFDDDMRDPVPIPSWTWAVWTGIRPEIDWLIASWSGDAHEAPQRVSPSNTPLLEPDNKDIRPKSLLPQWMTEALRRYREKAPLFRAFRPPRYLACSTSIIALTVDIANNNLLRDHDLHLNSQLLAITDEDWWIGSVVLNEN